MRIYHFRRKQVVPASIDEAWKFFSLPENLLTITPPRMRFRITSISGQTDDIYEGQIICYRVRIFPWTTTWMTEITHVRAPFFFVDEQRVGPYRVWNHQHHFRSVSNGVEVTDEITYAIPFGVFGRMAHQVFVKPELEKIFNYRGKVIRETFHASKTL